MMLHQGVLKDRLQRELTLKGLHKQMQIVTTCMHCSQGRTGKHSAKWYALIELASKLTAYKSPPVKRSPSPAIRKW